MPESPIAAVPLLDLKAQFAGVKDEIMARVARVFEEQAFILGAHVAEAEKALAAHLGVKHAIGVSSGTDALILALMALGVGPGDAVVTSPFTFFATVGSIVRLGARPVFADIEPDTYNLDPARVAELLAKWTLPSQAKVLLPVHLFGQPASLAPLLELARDHRLYLLEDAAQAIGAVYPTPQGGRIAIGAAGAAGCFSFFPSKNLGAAGDGGLVTTNDDALAEKLRSMRTHGSSPREKYLHLSVGGNFRLDALQAAVVSAKLPHLEAWSAGRRANAERYARLFGQTKLVDKGMISLPVRRWPAEERSHIYNQYVIRARDREGLIAALNQAKIGNAVYYPLPLHLQPCFKFLGGREGDFPVAERAAREVLALPVYPELTEAMQARVVEAVARFYGE